MLAYREARFWGHDQIGTGDLLLGLSGLGEGSPVLTLEHLGVSVLDLRVLTLSLFKSKEGGGRPVIDRHAFSGHDGEVLEMAFRESLSMKDDFIGPEHLLVGLAEMGEGVAAEVFRKLCISPNDVRAAILQSRSLSPLLDQPSATPQEIYKPDVVVVIIHETSGSGESRLNDLRRILPAELGETRVQVIDGHAGMRTVYPLGAGLDLASLCFAATKGPACLDVVPDGEDLVEVIAEVITRVDRDAVRASRREEEIAEVLSSLHLQLDVDGSVPNFYLIVLIADRPVDSSSKPTDLVHLGTDVVYLRAGHFGTSLQSSELSAEQEGSLTILDLRYSSADSVAEVVASAVGQGIVRVWREMRLGGG